MRELHLFAGVGGGILAGHLLGHTCVGAVELERYARRVLRARQADGSLDDFPIHDDVQTFSKATWPQLDVDIVAGGFPCQDISLAGSGRGLDGKRSGLWWDMHRIVRELEPAYVFVENTPALLARGFHRVLGSLADIGFDAEWCVLSAADCGAPHLRRRLWLLAAHPQRHALRQQQQRQAGGRDDVQAGRQALPGHDGPDGAVVADSEVLAERAGLREGQPSPVGGRRPGNGGCSSEPVGADADGWRWEQQWQSQPAGVEGPRGDESDGLRQGREHDAAAADSSGEGLEERQGTEGQRPYAPITGGGWWSAEPAVGRVANGIPDRVGQLRGLGNAQVPIVAARAFQLLMSRF